MLLSFQLFGNTDRSAEKQLACLCALSRHTQDHYSRIVIPKRNGSPRFLLVPDSLLKQVQKNLLHHVLEKIPISPYAKAYYRKASVMRNAAAHVRQKQVLRLDIEDFFGTICFPMVYQHAFPWSFFPPAVRTLLTHLCCYQDYLPQGAPTSAAVSNLVMKPFDEYIGQWCTERNIVYTRYCDDMVFSGDFDARTVKNKVQNFLQTMGFNLNQRKTRLVNQHQQQLVTGLVVNEKVQVPIGYRKQLRKEIYYCQKYGVHSHLMRTKETGAVMPEAQDIKHYLQTLQGKVSFVLQANPDDAYFQEARRVVHKMIWMNA